MTDKAIVIIKCVRSLLKDFVYTVSIFLFRVRNERCQTVKIVTSAYFISQQFGFAIHRSVDYITIHNRSCVYMLTEC